MLRLILSFIVSGVPVTYSGLSNRLTSFHLTVLVFPLYIKYLVINKVINIYCLSIIFIQVNSRASQVKVASYKIPIAVLLTRFVD